MNPFEMLHNDHVAAQGLLKDLINIGEKASRKERMQMLNLIEREVKIHTALEEKIFYPALRKAAEDKGDKDLVYDAVEEHDAVDKLLPELKLLALKKDGSFEAKVRLADKLVNQHIELEEEQMFPRMKEIIAEEKLEQIGEKMTDEKEKLFKSWKGMIRGPLHRGKTLVDAVTPLAAKEVRVKARAKTKTTKRPARAKTHR
ncbi:MAG TPA: hemerythrin domain-containing protein [Thermoanaerobaculia bacterium]|nr:hemerythrin domain-containing protein [Thermoanaerobaculia bacterium]